MKYEEFDQQIREMIPQPSAAITDALYRMGVEALEDRPQDLLIAFEFISRYFSVDVLQGVYEIIQHGSAVLPNELVAAAVFLQAGDTSEHMAQMAKNGELMCFYSPREKGEISPWPSALFWKPEKRSIISLQNSGSLRQRISWLGPRDLPSSKESLSQEHLNVFLQKER